MSPAGRSDPPIPNSYWVRPGCFAAGEYPGDRDPRVAANKVRALLDAGIDHFIDLTQRRDGLLPYEPVALEQGRAAGLAVRRERHPITRHVGATPARRDDGRPRRHRRRS